MRLKHLLSVFLTLLTLSVGQMWGASTTVDLKTSNTNLSSSGITVNSNIAITFGEGTYSSLPSVGSTYTKIYAGNTITFTPTNANITQVVMTASSNDYIKTWTKSAGTSITVNNKTATWTGSQTSAFTLTNSASAQARITQIAITYTVNASYTVTWTINPAAGGSLSATSGTSTTVTPNAAYTYGSPAYTVTSGTATVSQSTHTFTATPTANCSIRINMVEKPKYTLTLNYYNSTMTKATVGASVTLPSRSDCSGYTFAGWSTSNCGSSEITTPVPTVIPAGSYTPTANVDLYPVYTRTEGTQESWDLVSAANNVTAGTYVITWDNSYYLPSETAAGSNPSVGSGITQSNNKLTNTVTSAMQWTFTGDNTNGYVISHVSGNNTYKLSSTNAAQGISVTTGSTDRKWTASVHATYGMLLHGDEGGTRYLAVYNNSGTRTWRYYAAGASYDGTLRLYKKTGGSTTYYISAPNCCDPLGSVNGSFLSYHFWDYLEPF